VIDVRPQAADAPALSVRSLSRRFAATHRPAVSDVSFDAVRGEIIAILGSSGCGKTTLLRMIAGFEPPSSGAIAIGGVEVEGRVRVPPEQRRVGLVFQETTLFPHMTVMDNVLFGLRSGPMAARRARAAELLALAGVHGLESRHPHEISGGQAQRVALARAVAPAPDVLLLDEPFNNLDSTIKRTLTEELWRLLRETRTTTLLVTHDLGEAFGLADRIAVIREGELQQIDTPQRLYAHPVNAYVAAFLGRTNLVPARPTCEGCLTDLGPVLWATPIHHEGHLVVSVRPHDLLLHRGWSPALCGVRGKVARVVFQGDRADVLVNAGTDKGGQTLVVSTPANADYEVGDAVTVCVRECPAAATALHTALPRAAAHAHALDVFDIAGR
jgi:iron(III) transport system ATP-binding protein